MNAGRGAAAEATGHVVFVCTGNTCRSPLAEALWRALEPRIPAVSCGVGAWPGSPAAEAAQAVADEYGVSLGEHRARRVTDITEPVWRVFTMTEAQARSVVNMRPEWADKVERITDAAGETGDIPDPLGASVPIYRGLAERLIALERRILDRYRSEVIED